MHPSAPEPSRAALFAAIVSAVVLLLVGLLAVELKRSYSLEVENAGRINQSLARVLEQQLLASIEKIDLIDQEAVYQFSAYLDGTGLPTAQMTPMLARLLARVPGVLSLRLINEEGRYVFDATGSPSAANIADRTYFRVHKAGTAAGLFPEGPLFSRVANLWTITFSRGVRDRSGAFRGIVQSSIASESLAGAFHGVSVGSADSITLVNSEGVIVARTPPAPDSIGKAMATPVLAAHIADEPMEGRYSAVSNVDGVRRIYNYRQVGPYPFFIVVGTSYDGLLKEWRRTAAIYGIVTLLLLGSALTVIRRAFRHFSDAERAAQEQRRIVSAVFSNSLEGIVVTDAADRVVTANAAFSEITGYPLDDVVGREISFLHSGRHDPSFFAEIREQLRSKGFWRGEIWSRRQTGEIFPELRSVSTLRDFRGEITHHIAVFTDITERKAMEERFRFLSEHDYLTGLPNRLWLYAQLPASMAATFGEADTRLALLFLDLDRFKNVNDSLGHNVGDLLLQELATRMTALLEGRGIVTRQGGDEFVILLKGCHDLNGVESCARALLQETARPFRIEHHEISITGSIGIATYPDHATDMLGLLKHADMALYEAKRHGRNQFAIYLPEMDDQLRQRVEVEADIRSAIENNEFVLYYQPQVAADDCALIGVEALLRWNHPRRGLLAPGAFLAIAEESMQIIPIGRWVLEEACRQAKAWLDQGFDVGSIAVNLSALQFQRENVLDLVSSTLARTGLPPERLELEITESVMMDDTDSMIEVLRSLKRLGVRLAIDDFGTGFSSLGYLERFNIDRIKVDRCFVECLHAESGPNTIAHAIINIAHVLRLEVVAEGVETETQYDYLRASGCDFLQGFLFARPLHPDRIAELYKTSRILDLSRAM